MEILIYGIIAFIVFLITYKLYENKLIDSNVYYDTDVWDNKYLYRSLLIGVGWIITIPCILIWKTLSYFYKSTFLNSSKND